VHDVPHDTITINVDSAQGGTAVSSVATGASSLGGLNAAAAAALTAQSQEAMPGEAEQQQRQRAAASVAAVYTTRAPSSVRSGEGGSARSGSGAGNSPASVPAGQADTVPGRTLMKAGSKGRSTSMQGQVVQQAPAVAGQKRRR
jgi:hypothetical protein